jgi:hypothetical protein
MDPDRQVVRRRGGKFPLELPGLRLPSTRMLCEKCTLDAESLRKSCNGKG